jgi:hypothetical protein
MNRKAGGAFVAVFLVAITAKAAIGIFDLGASAQNASASSRINAPRANSQQLDGWIREALVIMEDHHIPGTYKGLHKNIIRESGGDPDICNHTDVNAANGIPSCGLLQVIPTTFAAHYKPLKDDPRLVNSVYDPVTNLVVAAHYAAGRYGSIDNVDGPY